ncbi:MAG: BrnT family toxin [Chloroflexi bacterium]|nr:BrnT family toxin [Chloroflexota bacterium]
MDIYDFIWQSDVIDKIEDKHHVTQYEAEEVFFNERPVYHFIERGERRNQDVYSVSGRTDAGRYLIVFFILKRRNVGLILSARDMTRSERRLYARRR